MRRATWCATAVLSLVLVGSAFADPPAVLAPPTARGPLLAPSAALPAAAGLPAPRLLSRATVRAGLEELYLSTPFMQDVNPVNPYANGVTGVRVLLPAGYQSQAHRRWPVLYLLHGCCGSFQGGRTTSDGYRYWTEQQRADLTLARAGYLVVMPDGLNMGWYADSFGAVGEGGPRVESYLIGQLLPWVDRSYRTIPDRAHRAVAGVSMGGFGAISLAARHPDLFGLAASFSGAVDLMHDSYVHQVTSPTTSDGLSFEDLRPPNAVFGQRPLEEVRERMHNPVDLAENLRPVDVMLFIGNGAKADGTSDQVEEGAYEENLALHSALTSARIRHTWNAYGAGTHQDPFFARDLLQLRGALASFLARRSPQVRSFDLIRGEQDLSVFGFRALASRDHLEMSRWSVSPRALVVRGSGSYRITTAPLYRPKGVYRLRATRNAQSQVMTVHADAEGRLSFELLTGVTSTGQQYRAQTQTYLNEVTVQVASTTEGHTW